MSEVNLIAYISVVYTQLEFESVLVRVTSSCAAVTPYCGSGAPYLNYLLISELTFSNFIDYDKCAIFNKRQERKRSPIQTFAEH